MGRFALGFMVCFSALAALACVPGIRVEWTQERRAILLHGKVMVEVTPTEDRSLAHD